MDPSIHPDPPNYCALAHRRQPGGKVLLSEMQTRNGLWKVTWQSSEETGSLESGPKCLIFRSGSSGLVVYCDLQLVHEPPMVRDAKKKKGVGGWHEPTKEMPLWIGDYERSHGVLRSTFRVDHN